ncbi:MMPL family transporter [Actinomadura decatromicini]|uniref:MMPL family transporter n=1 Tax=Actinomadura decatromicini TaxID=2604572 RepID=A0A5D3F6W1_9ACTN|nr:MMPL family transporter [Actinomadura decatromicini]
MTARTRRALADAAPRPGSSSPPRPADRGGARRARGRGPGDPDGLPDYRNAALDDALRIVPLALLAITLVLGMLLRSVVAPLMLLGTVLLSCAAFLGVALLFTHVRDHGGRRPTRPHRHRRRPSPPPDSCWRAPSSRSPKCRTSPSPKSAWRSRSASSSTPSWSARRSRRRRGTQSATSVV